MQKWEYLVVVIRGNHTADATVYTVNGVFEKQPRKFQSYLFELGMDGWESTGIREDAYYFKRPLENYYP